jgi:hypothetical protein
MSNFWTVVFFAILIGLTLLAISRWYARRGASVPEAERRVLMRFTLGLVIFWLFAIAVYFGGPLLSTIR